MTLRVVLRSLGTFVVALVAYFLFPSEAQSGAAATLLIGVALLLCTAVLAVLIVGQARRELQAGADESTRVQSLLVLVYMAVLVFALGYYLLEKADTGQFAGLETKIDSLYFTITTLATVGFGDVHATGQLARGLVTVQIVFNLVFLAVLVRTLTSRVQRRRAQPRP